MSEKYYKLKEQCAKNADAAKSRDHPKPTEQKPFEPTQHTRKQESQLLFNKQSTPWAATSVKESHTVEKAEQKPTVPRQNKENLFPQDKPDACKTQ